jgi:hypothetical protein
MINIIKNTKNNFFTYILLYILEQKEFLFIKSNNYLYFLSLKWIYKIKIIIKISK